MQIMAAGCGVVVMRSRVRKIFTIHGNGVFTCNTGLFILPTQNIDMPRHMVNMPGIRTKPAKSVGGVHCLLRLWGHFQQVYMQVQDRRMLGFPRLIRQGDRALADRDGLNGIGSWCGTSLFNIPKVPWRAGHHRFSKKRHHIQVIRKILVDLAHRICIGIVPAIKFCLADRIRFLDTLGKRIDECYFKRCCAP